MTRDELAASGNDYRNNWLNDPLDTRPAHYMMADWLATVRAQEQPPARKVVQIAVGLRSSMVVCNDGAMFVTMDGGWVEVGGVPQPGEGAA
jgi:hypothetical protein